MYDVAIIGGGVVGGMIARELAKYQLSVCLLEKENDVAMGTSKANSAIIHAGFDAKPGTLKAKLNVQGSNMMRQIVDELGVKYKQNGSLVIGFCEEDRNQLEILFERGRQNGVWGLEILDGNAARKREPNLSETVTCALYAPTGAIVCPYELTVAAIGNAMDNGAELRRNFCVDSITKTPEGYCLYAGADVVESRFVVNAAGLYADKIAALVGDDSFNIKPRRGEYILLDKACGNLVSHTIFRTPSKMGKGILVSPTVDGNLLLGPTSVDIADKADTGTTAEGLTHIIKEAGENVNGIPFGKVITSFCGLRAVGDAGDFIINSPCSRFVNVGGIESPGLSASPAIAKMVAEMLQEQGLTLIEKENYNPKRKAMHSFREASLDEKNRIIRQNPAYGKIICRCEGVTEGEILNAIRTNPKPADLDGVKRRTRAQMGRCQGGFCMPYIVNLLAKEMGVMPTEVTKSGGASVILTGMTKEGSI